MRWVWVDDNGPWLIEHKGTSYGTASVSETHVDQATVDAEEQRKLRERGRLGFTGDVMRGRRPTREAEDR